MRLQIPISKCRGAKWALTALAIMGMTIMAQATPVVFLDDFNDGVLDPAWTQGGGYAAGHLGESGGTYNMTTIQGTSPKLARFGMGDANPLYSYTQEITVVLDTFFLAAAPGTTSDLKIKSFGADGFMEFVINSGGNMRLWHAGDNVANGNLVPNTALGMSDGDSLTIVQNYNVGTDTMDISFAVNGGAPVAFHSGGGLGVGGAIGNVIGNFIEAELYKYGTAETNPVIGIDEWSVIPEPATLGLLGMSAFGIYLVRRFAS